MQSVRGKTGGQDGRRQGYISLSGILCCHKSRVIFIVSPISFLFYQSKFWPDNSTIYARFVVHANGILSGESPMSVVHCVTCDHDDQLEADG